MHRLSPRRKALAQQQQDLAVVLVTPSPIGSRNANANNPVPQPGIDAEPQLIGFDGAGTAGRRDGRWVFR